MVSLLFNLKILSGCSSCYSPLRLNSDQGFRDGFRSEPLDPLTFSIPFPFSPPNPQRSLKDSSNLHLKISFQVHPIIVLNSSFLHLLAALYFVAVATVAALAGQSVVRRLIILLGRASLIIFILALTIFISAISLGELDFLVEKYVFTPTWYLEFLANRIL